ncbi:hypothetical protein MKW98_010419 [Papaver atlanticum]|uniref:Amino acid transporter transmembrane domain-containing protein n=1 Tax=Papaver atlanticum TaxID=357466 RepID=A0AAD4SFD2_9MAGN|nr:hypothetical protein MKW98_010419 [Papaver atlanticum]
MGSTENSLKIPFIESLNFCEEHVIKVDNNFQENANSSFLISVINMTGLLIGLGQLSTAYALENGGWASCVLLSIGCGCGISCNYNYTDIAYQAFGTNGEIIALSFIYLDIFMALVSFTISMNDNLNILVSGTHLNFSWFSLSTSQTLTLIAILVSLPTVWMRDSKISFISTFGIFLSLSICVSVGFTAVFGGVKANKPIPVLRLENILPVSGLYIFSFASHMVMPDIYRSMKDPSRITEVSIMSFGIVTFIYTVLGFMGAKMFGPEVRSQITLSMPENLIFTEIALWATALTPITKYVFLVAPVASQVERNFPSWMSFSMKTVIRNTVGSLFFIFVLVLALTILFFEKVLGLTGSLVSVGISMILPCFFYLKIYWPQISVLNLVLHFTIITACTIVGVLGTISNIKSLIETLTW